MTKVIVAQTRLDAWLEATEYLLTVGSDLNLILSVSRPGYEGADGKSAAILLDKFFVGEGELPLHTVAETIFPAWEYQRRGLQGLDKYADIEYPALKKAQPQAWGTYAYRLLRRRTANGETVNPLRALIDKMKSELSKQSGGSLTACYEIGVAEGEYDLPLYNSVDDQARRRGGPCLSHLSFKLFDGAIHLTAMYRSHDYRYKVPGNLLGLARLQACVAGEVGVPIGTLVVHSTYAWLSQGKGKRALAKLLSKIHKLKKTELS